MVFKINLHKTKTKTNVLNIHPLHNAMQCKILPVNTQSNQKTSYMYREKVLELAKIFTPAKFQHANFRDSLYGQLFALTTYS